MTHLVIGTRPSPEKMLPAGFRADQVIHRKGDLITDPTDWNQ
jgi:hypothetical protein